MDQVNWSIHMNLSNLTANWTCNPAGSCQLILWTGSFSSWALFNLFNHLGVLKGLQTGGRKKNQSRLLTFMKSMNSAYKDRENWATVIKK